MRPSSVVRIHRRFWLRSVALPARARPPPASTGVERGEPDAQLVLGLAADRSRTRAPTNMFSLCSRCVPFSHTSAIVARPCSCNATVPRRRGEPAAKPPVAAVEHLGVGDARSPRPAARNAPAAVPGTRPGSTQVGVRRAGWVPRLPTDRIAHSHFHGSLTAGDRHSTYSGRAAVGVHGDVGVEAVRHDDGPVRWVDRRCRWASGLASSPGPRRASGRRSRGTRRRWSSRRPCRAHRRRRCPRCALRSPPAGDHGTRTTVQHGHVARTGHEHPVRSRVHRQCRRARRRPRPSRRGWSHRRACTRTRRAGSTRTPCSSWC